MAAVTLTGAISLVTPRVPDANRISGLLAGEAIVAGDLCYIKSDGKIWKSNGTSADAAAQVRGMALLATAVGEAITLYHDVDVRYGAGLTPGAQLYLSATAGLIVDAATTGGSAPIGYVKSATVIHVYQSRY